MWYVVEKIEADVKFIMSCAYYLPTVQQNCKNSKQKQKEKLLTPKTNKHTYINEYILLLGFTDCLSAILSGLHAKSKLLQTVVAFNYPTDFFSNLLQLSYYFSNTFTNSSQLQRVYYTTKSSQFSFFKLNNKDTVSLTITY